MSEHLSRESRALLEAAKGDSPTPEDRARIRRKVMAAVVALPALDAATAEAAAAPAAGAGMKIAGAFTLATLVAVGGAVWMTASEPTAERSRSADSARIDEVPAPNAPATAEPMQDPAHAAEAGSVAAPLAPDALEPALDPGKGRESAAGVPALDALPSGPLASGSLGSRKPADDGQPPAAGRGSTLGRSVASKKSAGAVRSGSDRDLRHPEADSSADVVPAESNMVPAGAEPSVNLPTASTLAAEAELLRGVRVALGDRMFELALELTAAHAERFENGLLTEERIAARAMALCGLGRLDEAAEVRAALMARSPRSPHLTRVREACDPER